jgi:hypothetical protein
MVAWWPKFTPATAASFSISCLCGHSCIWCACVHLCHVCAHISVSGAHVHNRVMSVHTYLYLVRMCTLVSCLCHICVMSVLPFLYLVRIFACVYASNATTAPDCLCIWCACVRLCVKAFPPDCVFPPDCLCVQGLRSTPLIERLCVAHCDRLLLEYIARIRKVSKLVHENSPR